MAKRAVVIVVNERARKEKGLQCGWLISLNMERRGWGSWEMKGSHTFVESGE